MLALGKPVWWEKTRLTSPEVQVWYRSSKALTSPLVSRNACNGENGKKLPKFGKYVMTKQSIGHIWTSLKKTKAGWTCSQHITYNNNHCPLKDNQDLYDLFPKSYQLENIVGSIAFSSSLNTSHMYQCGCMLPFPATHTPLTTTIMEFFFFRTSHNYVGMNYCARGFVPNVVFADFNFRAIGWFHHSVNRRLMPLNAVRKNAISLKEFKFAL